jgi:carbamoyl-phosphate synthase large subunit
MTASSLRILLTGVGAPGTRGTIYALRKNSDNVRLHIIGTDVRSDNAGPYLVDAFRAVPPGDTGEYPDALLRLCQKESVDLVIPQTTMESQTLSHYKARFGSHGVRIMVSDGPAMDIANNKWRVHQSFETLGLPYPQYHLTKSESQMIEAAHQLGYPRQPVVVKPPISNGMRGLRILMEDAWDVNRFLREKPSGTECTLSELVNILHRGKDWPDLLLTEYLPGNEYTVDAFLGQHVGVAIPRIRKEIRSGISFNTALEYRNDLIDYTLAAASALGLRYAFGFQFKLDSEGIPKVLECNPRIQGTMVASTFSGVNVIWMSIQELLGNPPMSIPPKLQDASFLRFWGGLSVVNNEIIEI